ncbi:MAG: SDR family NAD(P)-dependent oxidoreductase [Gammaproteobacteria bacterium]|nr:SDR family NAD(P)-dependent oxidoreductase [Gammaproteobacteria bacterium]MDD9871120.1 SDR family NAD(P)-dependent oxidoreductase [Gammaproteobacteria bacterium]
MGEVLCALNDMQLGLEKKSVAVTGAGGGIGRVIARAFAGEGARVLATDLDSVIGAAASESGIAHFGADLCTLDGAEAAVAQAVAQFGGLDVVVNCAGISEPARLEETTEASWQRVININLSASWRMCRAALPELKKTRGNIVNIASFAGKRGTLFGDNAAYTASKAGVIGLTHALALECAQHGVRVNAVAPGPVATPMLQALPAEKRGQLAAMIPLGALPSPQGVADAVVFLASARAAAITGEITDVNGGLYLD